MRILGPRRWMWASLGLTLLVGVCLGVLLDRLIFDIGVPQSSRGSRDHGERLKARLEGELNLSPEQREKLEKVLSASREKARVFWTATRSSYGELRKELREQIRSLLTPEQQKHFDEMIAREEDRRRGPGRESKR